MHPLFLLSVIAILLAVVFWIVDLVRLRSAARRIDASYRTLELEPEWTPMIDPQELGADLKARLDKWEALCREQFNFMALTRLRESNAQGVVLGARVVLLNSDKTIAATFGCSHKNPLIAFRSFISLVGDQLLMVTDAKTISTRPANHIVKYVAKDASEVSLLNELQSITNSTAGNPATFDSIDAYVNMQLRLWRDAYALRKQQGFVVELDALRRLAPSNLSEARLQRIHRHIVSIRRKGQA